MRLDETRFEDLVRSGDFFKLDIGRLAKELGVAYPTIKNRLKNKCVKIECVTIVDKVINEVKE